MRTYDFYHIKTRILLRMGHEQRGSQVPDELTEHRIAEHYHCTIEEVREVARKVKANPRLVET